MKATIIWLSLFIAVSANAQAELPVVIIDAGHGGSSKNKIVDESYWNMASFRSRSLSRTFLEKDLALEMALQVANRINSTGKAKAVLTRTEDRNIGMTERTIVANSQKVKAFVSIHFNNSDSHKDRGPVATIQAIENGNTPEQHLRDKVFGFQLAKAVETITNKIDPESRAKPTQDYDIKSNGSPLFRNLRRLDRGKRLTACNLEVEFLDNPMVAKWLLESDIAIATRKKIADKLADEIVIAVKSID